MSNALDALMTDLVARIEAGTPPWRQPWSTGAVEPGLPRRATGEPFSGSNAWTLAFAGALAGYAAPCWFTFRQALAIGAPVRRGERSTPALLYKTGGAREDDDSDEDAVSAERPGDPGRFRRYLKVYAVFNAKQLQDCPERFLGGPPVDPEVRRAAQDAALDAVPADVVLAGVRAYYDRARDAVVLPPPERFATADDFRSTRAHELVHYAERRIMPHDQRGRADRHRPAGRRLGIIRVLPETRAAGRRGGIGPEPRRARPCA